MAELIAKVGSSTKYHDGDCLHAMTDRKVLCANGLRHLCARSPGSNNNVRSDGEGLLPLTDPLFDWMALTSQFRFERIGPERLRITQLIDSDTRVVEGNKPYIGFSKKTEQMDVKRFVARRRESHRSKKQAGFTMFGTPGREVWFGGQSDFSMEKVAQGWTAIENKLQIDRTSADNRKWPLQNTDLSHAVSLPVAELDENKAEFIEAPGVIHTPGDAPDITAAHRTSRVEYLGLPGLDPALARQMHDRFVAIDIRDYYLWELNEILLEFGNMNSFVSTQRLADEIANDPESLGYSGMSAEEVLVALTAKNRTWLGVVTSQELLAWAAHAGRLIRLEDAAADITKHPAVRSAAKAAVLMVTRDGTSFDMELPDRTALLAGLVAAGVLTEGDKSALQDKARVTNGTRAQQLFGADVAIFKSHVDHALFLNS